MAGWFHPLQTRSSGPFLEGGATKAKGSELSSSAQVRVPLAVVASLGAAAAPALEVQTKARIARAQLKVQRGLLGDGIGDTIRVSLSNCPVVWSATDVLECGGPDQGVCSSDICECRQGSPPLAAPHVLARWLVGCEHSPRHHTVS